MVIRQEGGRDGTLMNQLEDHITMPDKAQNKQVVKNIGIDIQIGWDCCENKNTRLQVRSLQSEEASGEDRPGRRLQITVVS